MLRSWILDLSKLWYSQPLYATIVEILQKKQGSLTDTELYEALKEDHDDLSFAIVNKALMKLEIQGLIHVFNLTKNKRGVELVKS